MENVLKKLHINFDEAGNTLISKEKLENLIEYSSLGELYFDENRPSTDGYLLIEKNSRDFYPFPLDELEQWEKDGSCMSGDKLFKITLVKIY